MLRNCLRCKDRSKSNCDRVLSLIFLCMEATCFNPIPKHLLMLFVHIDSNEELMELKTVLMRYYSERMDAHLDNLWKKGILSQEKLDELRGNDLRELNHEQDCVGYQ